MFAPESGRGAAMSLVGAEIQFSKSCEQTEGCDVMRVMRALRRVVLLLQRLDRAGLAVQWHGQSAAAALSDGQQARVSVA